MQLFAKHCSYSYKKGLTEKPQNMQPASAPLVFGEAPEGAPL